MSLKFSSFDDGFIHHLQQLKSSLAIPVKSPEDLQARIIQMAGSGAGISRYDLERVIGTNDFLRFNYLQRGIIAGKPVARIRVNAPFGAGGNWGTGFLITPRLLITNNHVISSPEEALLATAEFEYQTDLHDYLQSGKVFKLRPDLAFITSHEEDLDYSIVAIEEKSVDGNAAAIDYGFIRLIKETHKVDPLEYVSIIQYPNGDEKCVAIRENKVIKIGDELGGHKDNFIWYVCDTAVGSSGAPVFNDQWQLVALHHKAVAKTKQEDGIIKVQLKDGTWIDEALADYKVDKVDFIANEGIRISRIVSDIKTKFGEKNYPYIKELLEDIGGVKPIAGTLLRESVVAGSAPLIDNTILTGTFSLTEAARKNIRPIEYYEGRVGYKPDFLETLVELPTLSDKALRFGSIAEVRNTDDNILRYTHFSLVFNQDRRLPFYTAVNIDGKRWKSLDRGSDKWFYDPRIAIELQIGNELYSDEPKNLGKKGWFDRGHLVRRLDPVWGSKATALLADEDTFHWTNCAPQYWGFNQGSQMWQGLENYILYNTDEEDVKASVFTGPIFREDDEEHRDIFIPQYFWKVVVVESINGKLYSSGYVADQSEWATNIPFEELPVGKYQDYQVPLVKIQAATGIIFPDEVKQADVLKGKSDRRLRSLSEVEHPRR